MISYHLNENGASQETPAQHQPGPNMLHQQTSMYTHVSPVFGAPYASNDSLMNNPNQLMRSKSLNDISNDSQIPAFGQGRSPYHQMDPANQNVNGTTTNFDSPNMLVQPNLNNPSHNHNQINVTSQFMPNVDDSIFNRYHQQQQLQQPSTRNNLDSTQSNYQTNPSNPPQFNTNHTPVWNSNIHENECSNSRAVQMLPHNASGVASTATPANMFNICNPLAMNLNGVTEQIGNLHL